MKGNVNGRQREMSPSNSKLHPFDPFLDTLRIKFEYFGEQSTCRKMGEGLEVRSVMYRKGEYVGFTRVIFTTYASQLIRTGSLTINLKDVGRCQDGTVLEQYRPKPRMVTWRMAKSPYATVVFSDSRKEPHNYDCSDGMVLEDWQNTIDSTEITHIQLLFTIIESSAECLAVHFKINRGTIYFYSNCPTRHI